MRHVTSIINTSDMSPPTCVIVSDGADVEIVTVVCNTQSANVRDNVNVVNYALCTSCCSHLIPVVSGEEDGAGGDDGVAPPPDHGNAGPGHGVWIKWKMMRRKNCIRQERIQRITDN